MENIKLTFERLFRKDRLSLAALVVTGFLIVGDCIEKGNVTIWQGVSLLLIFITILFHILNSYRLIRLIYPNPQVPFFICSGQSKDFLSGAIRDQLMQIVKCNIPWREIKNHFLISDEDWVFHKPSSFGDDSNEWHYEISEIVKHFEKYNRRIARQPVCHIFLACPAPVALAFGATIRRNPIAIYQHTGAVGNPYKCIASIGCDFSSHQVLDYHSLNARCEQYQKINITEINNDVDSTNNNNQILIVLNFSGHNVPIPYPVETRETYCLSPNGIKGHIPFKENWIDIAQEIASFILSHCDQSKSVSIIVNAPASLALILGTILGTTGNIDCYYYCSLSEEYIKCFSMKVFSVIK